MTYLDERKEHLCLIAVSTTYPQDKESQPFKIYKLGPDPTKHNSAMDCGGNGKTY